MSVYLGICIPLVVIAGIFLCIRCWMAVRQFGRFGLDDCMYYFTALKNSTQPLIEYNRVEHCWYCFNYWYFCYEHMDF